MMIRRMAALFFMAALSLPAHAADRSSLPTPVRSLLDCASVTDNAARLQCYDARAREVSAGVDNGNLVIADRAQINRARHSLFGLLLPHIPLLGGNANDDPGLSEIDATIHNVVGQPGGRWLFVLDDGARWLQIDDVQMIQDPRAGMPIHIRRAAMGSFLANVNHQLAVRVRRVN